MPHLYVNVETTMWVEEVEDYPLPIGHFLWGADLYI